MKKGLKPLGFPSSFILHTSAFRDRRSRCLSLSAVIIVLLATWLRIYRIDHQSYWNDEGNSLGLAGRSVATIVRSAAADIHPPGYYLALKAWAALTGNSELALRGFSALTGIVLIALLYRLGKAYFGPRVGVVAALVGAFNPFLVYYAQEARMYALVTTLGAASFLCFSLWLRSSRPPAPPLGDRRLGLVYSLLTAAGLYTHYAFGFVLIAQNVAALGGLLAHRGSRVEPAPTEGARPAWLLRLGAWVGWQALALVLYLPWLPTALRQLTTWPAERETWTFGAALMEIGRYLAFGRTLPTSAVLTGLTAVAGLLFYALIRRGQTITPLLWLAIPAALTLGFGLLSEAFAKFLLVAVPALCLLLAQGLAAVPAGGKASGGSAGTTRSYGRQSGVYRPGNNDKQPTDHVQRTTSRVAGGLLLVAWLAALGAFIGATYASLNNLYFNSVYFRDDYRGIAAYVAALARLGDAIITIAPNQVEAFGYYHRAGAPIYPLPRTRPLDPAETDAALADIAARHTRLFVLYWGDQQADPEHRVEQWLNTHTFKAGEAWYGQVRLATYAAAAPAAEPSVLSGARLGEHITLVGYHAPATTLVPGDILQVTLFWRTDAPLEARYKVFVHLYAAVDQPPVAQQDGEPGGGLRPTSTWTANEVVADNHGILVPADLPPGDYQLRIGLYELFTNVRLPVIVEATEAGDSLSLGTVTIE